MAQRRSQQARRVLLLALVDVAAAAVVALLVSRTFGAVSGIDTNPAVCFNTAGGVVSCPLTPSVLVPATFVVVLAGLAAWQTRRCRRHSRP
jgi:hypothetical protein